VIKLRGNALSEDGMVDGPDRRGFAALRLFHREKRRDVKGVRKVE
jgi:hypothetical protein